MISEIPFKEWKQKTAANIGVKVHALEQRLSSGTFPFPKVRRVNQKVIYVPIMNPQVIKREQMVVAACLADEEGGKPGACVCTALAYWPYWESPEASKLAEAITKCIQRGKAVKPSYVKLFLDPEWRAWVDHPTFQDGLPYSCVEDEARQLLPFYQGKRIVAAIGRAYEVLIDHPEAAQRVAKSLIITLQDVV